MFITNQRSKNRKKRILPKPIQQSPSVEHGSWMPEIDWQRPGKWRQFPFSLSERLRVKGFFTLIMRADRRLNENHFHYSFQSAVSPTISVWVGYLRNTQTCLWPTTMGFHFPTAKDKGFWKCQWKQCTIGGPFVIILFQLKKRYVRSITKRFLSGEIEGLF